MQKMQKIEKLKKMKKPAELFLYRSKSFFPKEQEHDINEITSDEIGVSYLIYNGIQQYLSSLAVHSLCYLLKNQ